MLRIYVSSTYNDLIEYRAEAIRTIERMFDCDARAMERYRAADARPAEFCLNDVRKCDVYVGIFGWRYGFIPNEENPGRLSVTEMEFREAEKQGIPTLIFVAKPDDKRWPIEDPADRLRIVTLRRELEQSYQRASFSTPDELCKEIGIALAHWRDEPDLSRYMAAIRADAQNLPLLPGRVANLQFDALVTPRITFRSAETKDAPARGRGRGAEAEETLSLQRSVLKHEAWLLVGDSGAGKSTALRILTAVTAEAWLDAWRRRKTDDHAWRGALIPVWFTLRRGEPRLNEQVWSALQRGGQRCSRELADVWLTTKSFLFLVDRLDESSQTAAIEEIEELRKLWPKSRFVVATRPIRALASIPWPRGYIAQLSPQEMDSFLARNLGDARAAHVGELLENHGAEDFFRRPLFAYLLSLSTPELNADARINVGLLLRDVIENRFLADLRAESSTDSLVPDALFLASAIAHEMSLSSSYELGESDVARLIQRKSKNGTKDAELQEALKSLVNAGILERRNGKIRFWHTTLCDYFNASWLRDNGTIIDLLRLSFSRHWHDRLLIFLGLLDHTDCQKRLKQLLWGFSTFTLPLRIGPNDTLANRFFFILRAYVQHSNGDARLMRKLFRCLPSSLENLFISEYRCPSEYSCGYQLWDEHGYYCDLIGRLRCREAYDYLQSLQVEFSAKALGLVHYSRREDVHRILDHLIRPQSESAYRWRHNIIVARILATPDEQYINSISECLTKSAPLAKQAIIKAFIDGLQMGSSEPRPSRHRIRFQERLIEMLIDRVLADGVEAVRDSASRLLRAIGGGRLPKQVAARLLNETEKAGEARIRAYVALYIDGFEGEAARLHRLANDNDSQISACALETLYFIDRSHLPFALIRGLRKHATDVAKRHAARISVELLKLGERHARIMALIYFGLDHNFNGFRRASVRVLSMRRAKWALPGLISSFREDSWDSVRFDALNALAAILEHASEPFAVEALQSQIALVRLGGVWWCGDAPVERRPFLGPRLFRLLSDADHHVQLHAQFTLQDFGYIDQEWHSHHGPPQYLGPAITSDIDVASSLEENTGQAAV